MRIKPKNTRNARPNARTNESKSIRTNSRTRRRESMFMSAEYQILTERRTKFEEATRESKSRKGTGEIYERHGGKESTRKAMREMKIGKQLGKETKERRAKRERRAERTDNLLSQNAFDG